MMYAILQKTPFPGTWEPMPLYQLQKAEYVLRLNKRHYHECALKVGDILTYRHEHAIRILGYWKGTFPFADFMLFGYPADKQA